jgi:hypothetical protein
MVTKLATILTILGLVFGAVLWVDSRYAKCAEVKSLERRVNLAETGTVLNAKQSRLWAYEDRYGKDATKVSDPGDRQEMKQLQVDVPKLQDRMKVLEAPPQ